MFPTSKTAVQAPQTLTEKIVQRYSLGLAPGKTVKAGDYVTLSPHHCMTHDNSWPVALKFMSIGATKIHDPKQIVMVRQSNEQCRGALLTMARLSTITFKTRAKRT